MPYISEHLSSLREEITSLRNANTLATTNGRRSEHEQTAFDLRNTRLREIKQELSKMLNHPEDPKVWWDRSRKTSVA